MAVRLSARGRLAILYTALVLAAGVALTALTYALVRRSMRHRIVIDIRTESPGAPGPPPTGLPRPEALADRVRATTLSELLTQAAIALILVVVLAAVLGWLVAGRVLRPIRAISATARRLSAENLSERMPVSTPADELAELADTVNGMLDRIQAGIAERDRALAGQRMFTANAAHELRTPLTTMRTAIEVTLDGEPDRDELLTMAEDVRTAIEHSRRTLDGLLALARGRILPDTHRAVDLAEVATGLVAGAADEAAARGIELRSDLRPAALGGDPILIERLVGNLLDNAVRYNRPGGHIAVTTGTEDARAFLRVDNSGALVAAEDADGLLEPFVRGEGVRTRADGGAGLGLSIVRAIVIAHRGEITTTARPTGGLDITTRFPASPPAPSPPARTGDRTCDPDLFPRPMSSRVHGGRYP
ncbi:sensor histidine kinase [Embleya sp. NPDC050154]|uniref:sensor histidine kinase n=1 Tax=unclassified Embleya TaxID=2699296 RepID=UPI0037993EEB